jgi:hypothetical protein
LEIRGEITNKLFSGADSVAFYRENILLANLKLGSKKCYKLIFTHKKEEGYPDIVISIKGFLNRRFLIEVEEEKAIWTYNRNKLSDFLYGKMTLTTQDEKFETVESDEKIQIFSSNRKIGTIKKVYRSIFDKGEYSVLFESKDYEKLFLIMASILAIKTEVIKVSSLD